MVARAPQPLRHGALQPVPWGPAAEVAPFGVLRRGLQRPPLAKWGECSQAKPPSRSLDKWSGLLQRSAKERHADTDLV